MLKRNPFSVYVKAESMIKKVVDFKGGYKGEGRKVQSDRCNRIVVVFRNFLDIFSLC